MSIAAVVRDEFSAGFFDLAAHERLGVRQCENGHFLPPTQGYMGPAVRCPVCSSANIDWVPASGEASLVSWTVAHNKDGTRQIAGLVELAEGPWMTAALGVETVDGLTAGAAMRVSFTRPEGGEAVPVFMPA